MGERRREPRLLVLSPGKILLSGSEIQCMVRNFSRLGACLVVQSTYGFPAVFQLLMQNQAPQTCKVIWRDDMMLGVRFVAAVTAAK
jgi:PilZ domain